MKNSEELQGLASRSAGTLVLEQSLIGVVSSLDFGVLLTDTHRLALVCNERFGQLFGLKTDEVVEKDSPAVRNMVRNRIDDFTAWEQDLEKVYENPTLEREDILTLKSPHIVLRRFTGPVLDEQGSPVGRIWTFLDVTDLHRRRSQLRAIREVAKLFSPDPTVICHQIAMIVSNMYDSLVLVSILNEDFLDFHTAVGIPGESGHIRGNLLKDSYCQFCIEAGQPLLVQNATAEARYEGVLPLKIGLTRYAGVPIFRPSGEIVGTFCTLDSHSNVLLHSDDIDFLTVMATRIGAELERQNQLAQLESALGRTNTELLQAQQRLIDSEKLAVTGTLAASVAHDIRNIVASASLQVEMLSDVDADVAASVQSSLDRFQVMAHRLMSYARPKNAVTEHVELGTVIDRVVELMSPQFHISDVELIWVPSETPAYILGDEGRLEHLIVNLLVNGLHASPAKSAVTVSLTSEEGSVQVSISDQGPGLPNSALTTLFQPFATSKSDGFGLGLYSCKCIVNDHEGTISVESSAAGAKFIVQFSEAK